jgi:hypothetical protein
MQIKAIQSALAMTGLLSLLISGCGGGGDGRGPAASSFADITVERGPLLHALVSDADGNMAGNLGNGVYRFNDVPTYPISTVGGYIDVNRSGSVDEGDVKAGRLIMRSGESGGAVTLCSSMAGVQVLKELLLNMGFTESQLLNATPSQDRMIAALSDELYKYAVAQQISDISATTPAQLESLAERIQTRVAAYRVAVATPAELELQLMNELVAQVDTVDATEAAALAGQDGTQLLVGSLPASVLSDDLKRTLAYMWNEEKLAKDVYFALNEIHPNKQLYNIASNSETQHQALMQALLEKYHLSAREPVNPEAGYSSADLGSISAGIYTNPALQSLYDTLYAKGRASDRDSLEVGCMVEVTDIGDLDRDPALTETAPDVRTIFEGLRSASYRHYWAFDRGLKAIGVAKGCCSLAGEYCHPEYPL